MRTGVASLFPLGRLSFSPLTLVYYWFRNKGDMRPCWWLNLLLLAITLWRYNATCAKVLLTLLSVFVPVRFVHDAHADEPSRQRQPQPHDDYSTQTFFVRLQAWLVVHAAPNCCCLHPVTGMPTTLFQLTTLMLEGRRVCVFQMPSYIGLIGAGVHALVRAVNKSTLLPASGDYKMASHQSNPASGHTSYES